MRTVLAGNNKLACDVLGYLKETNDLDWRRNRDG